MSKYTHLVSDDIRETIEEYIEDAGLKAHDPLPPERAFSELLGVNRLSLRRALQQMAYENMLYTRHGKGTFVAPAKYLEDTTFLSFSSGWEKEGYAVTSDLLHFRVGEANIKSAQALDVTIGTPVYDLRRLRYVNGDPLFIERSFLPVDVCPGLNRFDFDGPRSLYATLEAEYGLALMRQEQNISITTLDAAESVLLHTGEGNSAFYTVSVSYDASDAPREYNVAINRADLYAIRCVAVTRG